MFQYSKYFPRYKIVEISKSNNHDLMEKVTHGCIED